jgi:predicted transcriptional regulator
VRFFTGAGIDGIWLIFIGWFLLSAATASRMGVDVRRSLKGHAVGDLMDADCPIVDSGLSLQALVDDHVLRTGRTCHVVVSDGKVVGIVTPHEVKQIDRARWPQVTIGEAMRPLPDLRTVSPETPLAEAFDLLATGDVDQLPVTSGGRLVGVLSRGQVLRFLQARSELGS